eukprot:TRINITY_DN1411_c0_g1_i1.p1 TRINITY_DN1411_c0_g1~~TRINITY_DN1411_c0_g1_i1.p1  ORF type:complete len:108 (+),score=10.08 TRINITY_DN1411_c0_g1_i1:38-361(+)
MKFIFIATYRSYSKKFTGMFKVPVLVFIRKSGRMYDVWLEEHSRSLFGEDIAFTHDLRDHHPKKAKSPIKKTNNPNKRAIVSPASQACTGNTRDKKASKKTNRSSIY